MKGYKSLKLAIKKAKTLYSYKRVEVRQFNDGSYAAFVQVNNDMFEAWTGAVNLYTTEKMNNESKRIFTFFLTNYRTMDNTF